MTAPSKGWIGVDLDGTLARYDGFKGETHIGPPVPVMLERVKGWLRAGYEVRIVTARAEPCVDRDEYVAVRQAIKYWCLEHIGVELTITNEKDYQMIELYDDRAVQVEANTGRLIGYSTLGLA
jgi:hypothetical protein